MDNVVRDNRAVLRTLLLASLVALASIARAEEITGKDVKVAVGDTLTLLIPDKRQHRITLASIAAYHPRPPPRTGPRMPDEQSAAFRASASAQGSSGGKTSGRPIINGRNTKKARQERREVRELIRAMRSLLD